MMSKYISIKSSIVGSQYITPIGDIEPDPILRIQGKTSHASPNKLLHGAHNVTEQQATWWLIPLSKWVITPAISGLTLLIPFITGVITHLLSGMSHQV